MDGEYAVWVSIADRQQALLNSEQYLDRQLERRGATWRDEDVNDLPAVEHWWVTVKAVEASGSVGPWRPRQADRARPLCG